jgi:hypothetical protein
MKATLKKIPKRGLEVLLLTTDMLVKALWASLGAILGRGVRSA